MNRAAAKVRDADVVVLLGRKQDFIIGFCRPPHVAADAKIIQIDPSPLEIGRNRGVDVGMIGDVSSVLEQMTKEAANYQWKELPWIRGIARGALSPGRVGGKSGAAANTDARSVRA